MNEVFNLQKYIGFGFSFLGLAIISAVFGALMPEMILFFAIAAIASYAISCFMLPLGYNLVAPVATYFIVFLLSKSIFSAVFSIIVFFTGFVLAYYIKKGLDLKSVLLRAVSVTFVLVALFVLSYIFIRGKSISYEGARQAFLPFINAYNISVEDVRTAFHKLNPTQTASLNNAISMMNDFLLDYLLPFIGAFAVLVIGFLTFVSFIIFRAIMKGFNVFFPENLAISKFKISKSAAIFYMFCFFVSLFGIKSSVTIAFQNVFIILNGAFFLGGIVFANNLMKTLKFKNARRILSLLGLLFATFIGLGAFISALGVVGTFSEAKGKAE